ncbi:hypothetical protein AAGS61_20165 [Lysinibacillus sp. KU-BSD001]|uniref:hypothetical protein n=1 Tax=Lysinibacillus sp. KU-BSD001 TaxID=3141328 RepID=UPI0036E3F9BF
MGNVYSAQNVAAYVVYELNEVHAFVNQISIQYLLERVDAMWKKAFGHSAFSEATHDLETTGYIVKEVYDAYQEYGTNHISLPAKEWFLKFGEFQLVHRTYGVPPFTKKEEIIVKKVLDRYRHSYADVAV